MFKIVNKIIQRILLRGKVIDFTTKVEVDNPAPNDISESEIYIVGGQGYTKWAYLKCPCGCRDVVTLSLMSKHAPNWKIKFDRFNRVTLHPSIWKTDGCRSHFWIVKGKLKWAVFE